VRSIGRVVRGLSQVQFGMVITFDRNTRGRPVVVRELPTRPRFLRAGGTRPRDPDETKSVRNRPALKWRRRVYTSNRIANSRNPRPNTRNVPPVVLTPTVSLLPGHVNKRKRLCMALGRVKCKNELQIAIPRLSLSNATRPSPR